MMVQLRSAALSFSPRRRLASTSRRPKDTDARIGVRRDPKNPDKKQKVFGYNLVLSTSVEIHLKIELPVAVTNISGNAEEGSQLIENKEQIHNHHHCQVKIDIGDSKYDIINNYEYIRGKSSIPIIDYNPRNEDLSLRAVGSTSRRPKRPSLIEAMIKKDGHLHLVVS